MTQGFSSDIQLKGKAIPWTGPLGFQEFEAPIFPDSRHMKVVRFSALGTGRLYFHPPPPQKVLILVRGCVDSKVVVLPEGLISLTSFGIEHWVFRLVAQPPASPRAPTYSYTLTKMCISVLKHGL